MPSPPPAAPTARRRRGVVSLTAVTVLCALVALVSVGAYVGLDPDDSRVGLRPWALHYPFLVVHVMCSVIALVTAPLQLWPALRRGGAHRVIGRIHLFAGVFPGAVSGLVVAVMSTYGPIAQTGFILLAVLWFTTAAAGWRAVRGGRYADHRKWMVRAFSLTMAGVMLRVLLPLSMAALAPLMGPEYGEEDLFVAVYPAIAWLCWVPNLLIAEFYLRRRGRTGVREPAPSGDVRG
ncbi:DUF2306 domain-containing protein [Nocardiopsis lambiniae]|uniref:DUF2306 domain-containing protein n=1 Tax=Nocardiopsis lambiniae TaxID=3075539 RepID=A0ABU2M436_9ACTN|nr:DUF2306 domain-containing protein [Nocardiopsis sp. DSM 44743]MDT0327071.1 DUF2306 domain-containing protein [Nocardiopsis sp. DSM 44743]